MIHTEDITAKARIRDAALQLFAKRGEQRVSMRQVAARAGVAVGSIQHHFGTRDGLLRAVNECVIGYFQDAINAADHSDASTPGAIAAARDQSVTRMLQTNPDILNYVRREILDPASSGTLLHRLTGLIQSEVRRARAQGIASTERRESTQVIQVLVRQIGALALQPLVDAVWCQVEPDPAASKPTLHVSVITQNRNPAAAPGKAGKMDAG